MNYPEKLEAYQKAINAIDDYFEYRYTKDSPLGVREEVYRTLEELTNNLVEVIVE